MRASRKSQIWKWARDGPATERAFTLIELLVVIAVIAVLLAIFMPCLNAARTVSRRTACAAHLKNIAHAWTMYLNEPSGRFYQAKEANVAYGGWRGKYQWAPRPLNSYLGVPADANASQAGIFRCPADRGGVPGEAMTEKAYDINGTSYTTNVLLIGQDQCPPISAKTVPLAQEINKVLPNLTINKITTKPGLLLLIGDFGWVNQWRAAPLPAVWKEQAEWHGRPDCYNLAFLDGHVRFLRIERGIYVADDYTLLPCAELIPLARKCQD